MLLFAMALTLFAIGADSSERFELNGIHCVSLSDKKRSCEGETIRSYKKKGDRSYLSVRIKKDKNGREVPFLYVMVRPTSKPSAKCKKLISNPRQVCSELLYYEGPRIPENRWKKASGIVIVEYLSDKALTVDKIHYHHLKFPFEPYSYQGIVHLIETSDREGFNAFRYMTLHQKKKVGRSETFWVKKNCRPTAEPNIYRKLLQTCR